MRTADEEARRVLEADALSIQCHAVLNFHPSHIVELCLAILIAKTIAQYPKHQRKQVRRDIDAAITACLPAYEKMVETFEQEFGGHA
jgi:hypothetical protein